MNPLFRAARENEADAVYALYKAVIGTPFCSWDEDYPGMPEIRRDIDAGNLFVLETEGRLIGAISIAPENELDSLEEWSANQNTGEFARVVIHPDCQGRRLARVLVANVLEIMRNRGIENVHISVVTQNIPAQRTYRHFGFAIAGQKEMWGHWFYLYELKL